jgi:hypothetical protein
VALAANPIGKVTAARVVAAYRTTRKLLIAADRSKPTLLRGTPTAYGDLWGPPPARDTVAVAINVDPAL